MKKKENKFSVMNKLASFVEKGFEKAFKRETL